MRVMLVGAGGQLGSSLVGRLMAGEFEVKALTSSALDITSAGSVAAWAEWQPELIINASAYTAVDRAESDVEQAFAVNKEGIKNLIALAKVVECPLFSVSTDYVFDGSASRPYKEGDRLSPLGVYGRSKRAGEVELENGGVPFVNIRTSWVFGESGNNFVKTMLRLGLERDSLGVVADQIGCPTYAGDIAAAIVTIAEKYRNSEGLVWGHFHYCGDIPVSWFGFAEAIFQQAAEAGLLQNMPQVKKITSDDYPTPAKRPAYSVLDCSAIKESYGIEPSCWQRGLKEVIRKVIN